MGRGSADQAREVSKGFVRRNDSGALTRAPRSGTSPYGAVGWTSSCSLSSVVCMDNNPRAVTLTPELRPRLGSSGWRPPRTSSGRFLRVLRTRGDARRLDRQSLPRLARVGNAPGAWPMFNPPSRLVASSIEVVLNGDATRLRGLPKRLVVALVLIGVCLAERPHRLVERISWAKIRGDRNGVA